VIEMRRQSANRIERILTGLTGMQRAASLVLVMGAG
jgi:hypothetical protein